MTILSIFKLFFELKFDFQAIKHFSCKSISIMENELTLTTVNLVQAMG